MKQFIASENGPLFLIGLIIVVMLIMASGDYDAASYETLPTPTTISEIASPAPDPPSVPTPQLEVEVEVEIRSTTENLKLRRGPGLEQEVISVLPRGTQVQILGETQPADGFVWVRVSVDEREGWVAQEYLSR
jgi:uncharacterized protein YgiM (DUF1202 family)